MKKIFFNPEFSYLAITAFLYQMLCNMFAYWYIPAESVSLLIYSIIFSLIMVFLFFILASFNRILFASATIGLFIISSVITYFMYTYRIGLSENIIAFAMKVDPAEIKGYFPAEFFLWTVFHLIVALILVYNYLKILHSRAEFTLKPKKKASLAAILACILLLLTFAFPRPIKLLRSLAIHDLPVSMAYSGYWYSRSMRYLEMKKKSLPAGDSSAEEEDITVVLIIGSFARADRFHCFGYERRTTPNLDMMKAALYPDATSNSIHTRWAVPRMLTREAPGNTSGALQEESIISFLSKMGFHTAWLSNQRYLSERHLTPITSYAMESDYTFFNNQIRADDKYAKRLDEELLPALDSLIRAKKRRQFIAIHTIGSSRFYDSHYSANSRLFTPVLEDEDPNTAYNTALDNSYDNTIVYADYFISEVVLRLQNLNALVFYVSDHGEILDSRRNKDSAAKRRGELHVPFVVWASETYKKENPAKYGRLMDNRKRPVFHDFVFHSILDGAGIKSPLINSRLSLFR